MAEDVKSSQGGPQLAFHGRNLRGGSTIAILGLVLLISTFAIVNPTVPRILAILVTLAGVGTAAGLIPVRAPQDYYGGLVLVLLAIFALVSSADLPGQRGFQFGPGTAPRLFSGLLAVLGAAVTFVGVVTEGPQIERYKIRGPILVIIAILLFAALVRPFGLVAATYLAFMVSILGSSEVRWIESLIAAGVMTLFCVLLFVNLLGLPFQLWPEPNGPAILIGQFDDILQECWLVIQNLALALRGQ